jgi:hypothetical protein
MTFGHLMTSTMSMTRAVALLSTRRDAHDLLEYQTDILHFLSKVNLLMVTNLNSCRTQVILVLLLLIDEAARERFRGEQGPGFCEDVIAEVRTKVVPCDKSAV